MLFILAKILKKAHGEYQVKFLFSDKENNFKRIEECTSEIQDLAYSYSREMVLEGIKGLYFDCNTKKSIFVSDDVTSECTESKLVLDLLCCEFDDDWTAWHVINHFVCKSSNYGSQANGKVFVQCGRKEKVEIGFDVELEQFDKILDEYRSN